MQVDMPVATLTLNTKTSDRVVREHSEPVYGGYANARGEIFLFGETLVYRVNFKNQSVQQRIKLNSGAQARYDETEAGDEFTYCNVKFQRLSPDRIAEVCSSGAFRFTPKHVGLG
jgi:hypothetical protein